MSAPLYTKAAIGSICRTGSRPGFVPKNNKYRTAKHIQHLPISRRVNGVQKQAGLLTQASSLLLPSRFPVALNTPPHINLTWIKCKAKYRRSSAFTAAGPCGTLTRLPFSPVQTLKLNQICTRHLFLTIIILIYMISQYGIKIKSIEKKGGRGAGEVWQRDVSSATLFSVALETSPCHIPCHISLRQIQYYLI